MKKKHGGSFHSISFYDHRFLDRSVGFLDKRKPRDHFRTQNEHIELSIPGWKFVSSSIYPLWIRIVWGTLIFMSFVTCLYYLFCQTKFFLSQPTMININVSQTAEVELPNIVLCPADLLEAERSDQQAANLFWKLVKATVENGESRIKAMWKQIRLARESTIKPSCGLELILSGRNHNNCKDFPVGVEEIFTPFGTCYQYNFNESLPYIGIHTLLLLRVPALKEIPDLQRYFELILLIYDAKTEFTTYSITRNARPVYHTKSIMVSIGIKEFTYLNKRHRKCEADAALVSDCLQRCSEELIDKAVTCKLPFMNSTKPDCRVIEIKDTVITILPILVKKEVIHCETLCTQPCRKVMYEIQEFHFPSMNENYTDIVLKFKDNSREIIEEVLSYEAIHFLSDIGGIFGLFTGVCILSLLEMFHIIILHIIKKW